MASTELRRLRAQTASADIPTVSVVIPCFNYARFLPAAVNSVRTQVGVATDVIIVDDASSDESLQVALDLAAGDTAIQVISHETNQGPVVTFNDGLARVTGTYLVRLDADDLLTPGSLERAATAASAMPDVGLVYGHPVHFDTDDPPTTSRQHVRAWTVWNGRQWLAERCASGVNVITSPEVLMRNSVVQRVGGQAALAHAHDMEMWFRMAAFSDVLHLDGPDQAWHREHSRSLSNKLGDPLASLVERRAAFDTLFSGPAGQISEAPDLAQMANLALAREALDRACRAYERNKYDEVYVGGLVAFAMQTYEHATGLREWRALEHRRALGQAAVRRRPWFAGHALLRRLREEVRHARWNKTGVYGSRRAASIKRRK